jgi:hypothetical protein
MTSEKTGHEAIGMVARGEVRLHRLRAHADPTGAADRPVDIDEAREVAAIDPGLVYLAAGWQSDLTRAEIVDPFTGESLVFNEDEIDPLTESPRYAVYLARAARYDRIKALARIETERARLAEGGDAAAGLLALSDEDLDAIRADLAPMSAEDDVALVRERAAYVAARSKSMWRDRVRVVERKRRGLFGGPDKSDGWRVEMRLSGDGEPEAWESPAQAAIFGPPALRDALDDARVRFESRGPAEAAASRLVTALEAAEPATAGSAP